MRRLLDHLLSTISRSLHASKTVKNSLNDGTRLPQHRSIKTLELDSILVEFESQRGIDNRKTEEGEA